MSHPTRATRRSAAHCCGRIDLVASRRLAVLWFVWLAIACGAILAVDLPLPLRIALCLAIAAINLRAITCLALLRGPRAVRWIEWEPDGQFRIGSSSPAASWRANLRRGAFRLGFAFLMLWFSTPEGTRGVLIDGGRQEPVAFRRLTRHLNRRPPGPPSGRRAAGS